MAVAHDRYKIITVSLLKRFRNDRFVSEPFGGFRSETATWIQEWQKNPTGTSKKALDIIVFQGGGDGRNYRNVYKTPRVSNLKQGLYLIHGHVLYGSWYDGLYSTH
jgi:hypothetical protein